jgi:hypothetical protein|tara:strand:- start:844 stop:1098 length:255 start_codon:yes stop_codon:yes gene_type:complete
MDTSNQSWDFIKWILSGVVTGLSFVMVYFFNQIQILKEKISLNEKDIALNDQHDFITDKTLVDLKAVIERLESKVDKLLINQSK